MKSKKRWVGLRYNSPFQYKGIIEPPILGHLRGCLVNNAKECAVAPHRYEYRSIAFVGIPKRKLTGRLLNLLIGVDHKEELDKQEPGLAEFVHKAIFCHSQ